MTQPLKGISTKEVQNVMSMKQVPVSFECMVEILRWCQQRTLEWVAEYEDAQRRTLATGGKEDKETANEVAR